MKISTCFIPGVFRELLPDLCLDEVVPIWAVIPRLHDPVWEIERDFWPPLSESSDNPDEIPFHLPDSVLRSYSSSCFFNSSFDQDSSPVKERFSESVFNCQKINNVINKKVCTWKCICYDLFFRYLPYACLVEYWCGDTFGDLSCHCTMARFLVGAVPLRRLGLMFSIYPLLYMCSCMKTFLDCFKDCMIQRILDSRCAASTHICKCWATYTSSFNPSC